MQEIINQKIDVNTIYKAIGSKLFPYKLRWNGKDYLIKSIGYHHRERRGKVMHHVFSVASDTLDFRLRHDPETLTWTLEEVSDGLTN